jgi:hypothetical protein
MFTELIQFSIILDRRRVVVKYSQTLFQYDPVLNLTHKRYQEWDQSLLVWENWMLISYMYNSSNYLTEQLHQDWIGTEWVNYEKITYDLLYNGNINRYNVYEWISNDWDLFEQYIYSYNANLDLVEEIILYRNSNPVSRSVYMYNQFKEVYESAFYIYNSVSLDWDLHSRRLFTYNVYGNPILIQDENYAGGVMWDAVMKKELTYSQGTLLTETIDYGWESATSSWKQSKRNTYEYLPK